jgi:hypothetical protein
MKRVLIVGSGVAGLAAAEIFARNNYDVVVAERSSELGGASSRAIQNWFHTGNLYLHRPSGLSRLFFSTGKLIKTVYPTTRSTDDVVNVNADGFPVCSTHPFRWFNPDDPIYYCYAKSGNGIPSLLRAVPIHKFWFKNVMVPRLLEFDRPFSFGNTPDELVQALHSPGHDADLDDFHIVRSSDTTLYSDNILNTLIAWCRANRVEFVTNASIELATMTRGSTIVTMNGEPERFDIVFLAAGAGNGPLLRDVGITHNLRVLYAPILVTTRRIYPHSFAIISPNPAAIFHHIGYRPSPIAPDRVSTIGGCTNVREPSVAVEDGFKQACMRRFNLNAEDVAGVYWGCKTEQRSLAFNRNYASVLGKVNDNLYWILPGKFSLFPYLTSLLISHFGLKASPVEFNDLAFDHPRIGLTMVQRTLRRSTHGQETPHLRAQRLHALSHSSHASVRAGGSRARR